jgi:hypothetical protein
MIANVVFLAMIVTATGLACVGAAVWVDWSIRQQIREDKTRVAARRWL